MKNGIGRDFEGWVGIGSVEQENGGRGQERQLEREQWERRRFVGGRRHLWGVKQTSQE